MNYRRNVPSWTRICRVDLQYDFRAITLQYNTIRFMNVSKSRSLRRTGLKDCNCIEPTLILLLKLARCSAAIGDLQAAVEDRLFKLLKAANLHVSASAKVGSAELIWA
ncbi:hypothetical protein O6P43_032551 [Quillaja saponaria]|uniref:Uncharacterized protein n=1 Tax=Quillaja saponaria TaxID=32244 RepID=A0AAD7P5L7_QUISA|nr:hypothetical protein O6P43_032551 [Quillaja saponaria]